MRAPLDIAEEKQRLRIAMRERLRQRGRIEVEDEQRIQERLLASGLLGHRPESPRRSCVALYAALPSEVSCAFLDVSLRLYGVRVCLPRVAFQAAGAPEPLEFRAAGPALERSPLGFDQPPTESELIPLEQIDVFVVPLRAADAQGNRLGRGRGHYDATLAAHPRALRIGLLLEAQLIDSVPVGPHDQRLDVLCTEARLLRCPPRAEAASL